MLPHRVRYHNGAALGCLSFRISEMLHCVTGARNLLACIQIIGPDALRDASRVAITGGLDKAKMRKIDGQFPLRELLVKPVKELKAEGWVELQAFLAHRIPGQDLRISETRIFRFADQPSLREGARQSAREGGFAVEHRARQTSVHH